MLAQRFENLAFDIHAFKRRFNDQIGLCEVTVTERPGRVGGDCLCPIDTEPPLLSRTLEMLPNLLQPLFERALRSFKKRDRVSRPQKGDGNAAPHCSGTDHSDR